MPLEFIATEAAFFLGYTRQYIDEGMQSCKSSKDHSKPRNEVDTSLKSPV